MKQAYDVVFLCTGNSARSILAECLLGRLGAGRFRAHSAGSHPKGAVHPLAVRLVQELGYDTAGLRSKSWDELAKDGAAALESRIRLFTALPIDALSRLSLQHEFQAIGRTDPAREGT